MTSLKSTSTEAVQRDPASYQIHDYQVQTPVYSGPLDLLLQLIERTELDITKLSLAQVTDQYLAHIQDIGENVAAEEVSAFLVIAAKLLQIKSEVLLPRPPEREVEEEDLGEALARQLKTYKRFKELAGLLKVREQSNLHTYLRIAPPPKLEKKFELSDITLDDLIQALIDAYAESDKPALATVVRPPKITIREKIQIISAHMRKHRKGTFQQLLTKGGRLDVVVTFLAVLELIKRRFVLANQQQLFGEIEFEAIGDWDENENFEIEFGE